MSFSKNIENIISLAKERLEIATGFEIGFNGREDTYFARCPELNIECRGFSEEEAVEILLIDIEHHLRANLSLAKEIIGVDKIVF